MVDQLLFIELDDLGEKRDPVEVRKLLEAHVPNGRGADFCLLSEIPKIPVDRGVMGVEGVPGNEMVEILGIALAQRDPFASPEVDQRIIQIK
jgi:hypothetical protein